MKINSKQIFWGTVFLLWLTQLIFTVNSTGQVRYEELAESVRNVFWLSQHVIYDGVSSNIGWYGTLLFIYNIFGFALNTAKYYRLILAAFSILCLALTLRKYFGEKYTLIPLLTIGLSPTLLYFNTLQTSYGIDLQYIPIILYLILTLDFAQKKSVVIKSMLIGFLTMVAWMSYPTVLFYLPALAGLYLYQAWPSLWKKHWTTFLGLFATLIAFLLPLMGGFLFVKDQKLLFYDRVTQSGIFRGAGSLNPNLNAFLFNVSHTLSDLFTAAGSYYYEVPVTDFSWILPGLAVFSALAVSVYLIIKEAKNEFPLLLIWLVLLLSLILGNLAFDPSGLPGIRRNTAILAAIYALITYLWYELLVRKRNFAGLQTLLIVLLVSITLQHLIALPFNIANLSAPSPYKYGLGFTVAGTPAESLDLLVNQVKRQDLKLACQDQSGKRQFCRYQEMYAAVEGSCLWNGLKCHQIEGFDPKTNQFIPLSVNLWKTYYWPH